jgi:hypothetical protein
MKFVTFFTHKPIPSEGWLIMNGRVRLQLPKDDELAAQRLMYQISKYVRNDEWVVICVWEGCIFITIKEHVTNQADAKRHCKESGYTSVIDCTTREQKFL